MKGESPSFGLVGDGTGLITSGEEGSLTLHRMSFLAVPSAGLSALPEPHREAQPLAASPPLLLCREGLSPAVPGAQASVLRSQVSPPRPPQARMHPRSSVGTVSSLVLVGTYLHPLHTLAVQCVTAVSTIDLSHGGTAFLLEVAPSAVESISTNLT